MINISKNISTEQTYNTNNKFSFLLGFTLNAIRFDHELNGSIQKVRSIAAHSDDRRHKR